MEFPIFYSCNTILGTPKFIDCIVFVRKVFLLIQILMLHNKRDLMKNNKSKFKSSGSTQQGQFDKKFINDDFIIDVPTYLLQVS